MDQILNIYKPIGITPYQLIQKFRRKHSEYRHVKIGYAGRLDPLAHGVMLLMIGDETKNRDKYLALPKSYEFEVLFGVETDTYDSLGFLRNRKIRYAPDNIEKQIKLFIKNTIGKQKRRYPSYSSKTVHGKPLYWWARNNKLSGINIPTHEIEIYDFELLKIKKIKPGMIKKRIIDNINFVVGDFRQNETLEKWNKFFGETEADSLVVATCRIDCSSGTYVRTIVNDMGKHLRCSAIALSIMRTKVGDYSLDESLRL